MGFIRRRTIPSHVASTLPLEPGERVLAAATDVAGRWHVGTARALVVETGTDAKRLPWETIERAEWDGDAGQLVVVETADLGEVEPAHRLALDRPWRLLELIRERITASIVLRHVEPVRPSRVVTVIARRAPHTEEPVQWSFVLDEGLSAEDPAVRAAVDRGLEAAKSQIR